MSLKIFMAILGFTPSEYDKMIKVGKNILANMYLTYAAEFGTPPLPKATLEGIVDDADIAQAATLKKGTDKTATRDAKCKILHDTIKADYVPYVNKLYPGDKEKIEHSGLICSKEPVPHEIPPQQIIKDVVKGKVAGTARVRITKVTGPLAPKGVKYIFTLYSTSDPAGLTNLKKECTTSNSHKLIAPVVLLQAVYFIVTAANAAGESELSAKIKYTAV